MQLLLDYKSNGPTLHPWVIAALEPLRSRGWLTTYSSVTNTTTWGPITVVGSGQAIYAASLVVAQEPRDIFLDAPLANLTGFPYGRDVAPLASTSFKQATGYTGRYEMTNGTKAIINNQIAEARARGMKVRYWDTTKFVCIFTLSWEVGTNGFFGRLVGQCFAGTASGQLCSKQE